MWTDVEILEDVAAHVKKFVFTQQDAVAEAVLYRYPDYQTRTVVCFSVQSGCPMGCSFCGTGKFFVRNLTTAEILAQVETCLEDTGVAPETMHRLQLMSMSMGEPLFNQANLIAAYEQLSAKYPNAELLISTAAPRVDIAPLLLFAQRNSKVGLQFSIHESSDAARDALIPFQQKCSLAEIAGLGMAFHEATGRKAFFNYCAHENNTRDQDARRLNTLFSPSFWNATVSVICSNDATGVVKSTRAAREQAVAFSSKLVEHGFDVRVFDPAGQDTIGGGCGQLFATQRWAQVNVHKTRQSAGDKARPARS